MYVLDTDKKLNFENKYTHNFLLGANFDWIGARKKAYIFSSIVFILSLASLTFKGLNYGVDFTGGRTYVIRFDKDITVNDVRTALTTEFTDAAPEVKTFGPSRQVKVTTKYMIDSESKDVDSIIQTKLFRGLKSFYTTGVTYQQFSSDDATVGILSSQKIGPTVADDIRNNAFMAIVVALIVIFIYIAIRFRKWQYGLAGVAALFHDSIIVLGIYSFLYTYMPFNMEIDQSFIAAILTIIGYSINDTVIIFDRIRENINLHPKKSLQNNINAGINSTLTRTINTTGTTLIVLIVIFALGGEVIRGFVFALLFGIAFGTYSSVFNASPIAFDLLMRSKKVQASEEKIALAPVLKK